MDFSLTVPAVAALSGTILLLAAAPTASSLLVVGNTLSGTLRHGRATAAGVAIADTMFALAAMIGLAGAVAASPSRPPGRFGFGRERRRC